jgi:hypothetical protein
MQAEYWSRLNDQMVLCRVLWDEPATQFRHAGDCNLFSSLSAKLKSPDWNQTQQ